MFNYYNTCPRKRRDRVSNISIERRRRGRVEIPQRAKSDIVRRVSIVQ